MGASLCHFTEGLAFCHKAITLIDAVILQAIKGTLKRDNLMGPCAGKTINDFQDDW